MAIDTQEKRMSAAGCGRTFMRGTFPSGTIDEQERIGIGHGYGGNALTPTDDALKGGAMTAMSAHTATSAVHSDTEN